MSLFLCPQFVDFVVVIYLVITKLRFWFNFGLTFGALFIILLLYGLALNAKFLF